MGLFDIFKRRADSQPSRLDAFLSGMSEDAIVAQGRANRERGLGIATAISLLTLSQSGRFARDVLSALSKAPVPIKQGIGGPERFDAIVFETAAFLGYSLLSGALRPDADDEIDPDSLEHHARSAHHLTSALLESFVSFPFNEQHFLNRPIAYSMPGQKSSVVEQFEARVLAAAATGHPATAKPGSAGADIGLSMVVAVQARTFAVTMVPAVMEVGANMYNHAEELGLA